MLKLSLQQQQPQYQIAVNDVSKIELSCVMFYCFTLLFPPMWGIQGLHFDAMMWYAVIRFVYHHSILSSCQLKRYGPHSTENQGHLDWRAAILDLHRFCQSVDFSWVHINLAKKQKVDTLQGAPFVSHHQHSKSSSSPPTRMKSLPLQPKLPDTVQATWYRWN